MLKLKLMAAVSKMLGGLGIGVLQEVTEPAISAVITDAKSFFDFFVECLVTLGVTILNSTFLKITVLIMIAFVAFKGLGKLIHQY